MSTCAPGGVAATTNPPQQQGETHMTDTETSGPLAEPTRRQALGGAAAGLLAMLVGFKSAHAEGKKLKVGLIMPNYDQLRWRNADQAFFEKEATKLGMEVLAQSSNAN